MTHFAYRGSFDPSFTTESHISASMELLGHQVTRIPERSTSWAETLAMAAGAEMFVWTSTRGWARLWDKADETKAVDELNATLPTCSVHLDLFHGLERAHWVREDGWFRLGHVFTADGDHPDEFIRAGVHHHWLPPAVFGPECVKGTARPEFECDVAFIGSHTGYGHKAHWPARRALLQAARKRYGQRFRCWPEPGQPAVRGQALNDLMATARVVLGDSCLAATSRAYWSDRAPETAGRGGALVFPYIEGLAKQLRPEEHVRYFMPGDHAEMARQIDWLLDRPMERRAMVDRAMAEVKANHCYTHRVETILETVFG